jgi:uncharacterized membrane protein
MVLEIKNKIKLEKIRHLKNRVGQYFGTVKERVRARKLKNQEKRLSFPLVDIALKHRIMATFSYLGILVLIPLIFGRKNEFIMYHARQGVALLGLWVIGIFSFYIPFLPWFVTIFILIEIIVGIVHVFTHREKRLPIIGRAALV